MKGVPFDRVKVFQFIHCCFQLTCTLQVPPEYMPASTLKGGDGAPPLPRTVLGRTRAPITSTVSTVASLAMADAGIPTKRQPWEVTGGRWYCSGDGKGARWQIGSGSPPRRAMGHLVVCVPVVVSMRHGHRRVGGDGRGCPQTRTIASATSVRALDGQSLRVRPARGASIPKTKQPRRGLDGIARAAKKDKGTRRTETSTNHRGRST